jgi:hypothetical protein
MNSFCFMAARFAGWISLLSFAIQQGNLLVTKYTKGVLGLEEKL